MASRPRASKQDIEPISIAPVPTGSAFLDNVVTAFVNAIPLASYFSCELRDGIKPPDGNEHVKRQHLSKFVKERLDDLARREYMQWMNGQLPFISPRELRLWRLQQFAQFLWGWQLPDDDDLALIFNLTKRQASNLAADFAARFRKIALFPVALRRVYEILRAPPFLPKAELKSQRAIGNVFRVPSRRYIEDTNALINEFRLRNPDRILRDAMRYERDDQAMWVSDEVVQLVADDSLREQIFALYRLPPPPT
jgi:hypothetical protein